METQMIMQIIIRINILDYIQLKIFYTIYSTHTSNLAKSKEDICISYIWEEVNTQNISMRGRLLLKEGVFFN